MNKKSLGLIEWLDERREAALRIGHQKDASYLARAREGIRLLTEACGDGHPNVPIRTYLALKMLRAWNHGTAGYNAEVASVVNYWIDGGMKGSIPWPESPFFAEWAEENGLFNVDGYVGFRFEVKLTYP